MPRTGQASRAWREAPEGGCVSASGVGGRGERGQAPVRGGGGVVRAGGKRVFGSWIAAGFRRVSDCWGSGSGEHGDVHQPGLTWGGERRLARLPGAELGERASLGDVE
jgi:hypothetical protein